MGRFATPSGKLAVLVLVWCYLYHLIAGLRHLMLDLHVGIALAPARASAATVLVLSAVLGLILAVRLW